VGYGQRLRIHKSADVRVLKAQLNVIAKVARAERITSPLWAIGVTILGSSQFGYFGRAPLRIALILPAAVTAVSLAAAYMAKLYQREAEKCVSSEQLQAWFPRFLAIQLFASATWALMPWLLWTPDDAVNHLFLAGWVGSVLAGIAINRANHIDLLAASLLPLGIIGTLRFVVEGSAFDLGIAALIPLIALQFYISLRRLARRIEEDTRLRFEVEDLAQELEEARDEALRKRFEAETANASKTAFLANMSHELRTPLNAILGFSEIIAQECFGSVGSQRYKEYAADIHSSGSHLLSLINDLLDVAKIEAGRMEIQPETLDARHTFETALKIIGAKARERRQELAIDIHPSAPTLFADERALKQILINLVSNAVKYTPIGGRISVLGTRAPCGSFQIVVEDNGPGIPRDKLDKMFKPFNQADNRYDRQGGGTGLGLALVRGLAELHGGRAWLESEQDKGCRALVVLPTIAKTAVA
jgi:two-component system cell cycle sensor histidine kinase PleC